MYLDSALTLVQETIQQTDDRNTMTLKQFCNIRRGLWLIVFCATATVQAHQKHATNVHYLGNEALLFESGDQQVLFDPFFHNDYGHYQRVPNDIRDAVFARVAPFDQVSVLVISHAHGDHFAAEDVAQYLAANKEVTLVAPSQATDQVLSLNVDLTAQLKSLSLEFGDAPIVTKIGDMTIESVRIPHAGWPQRKEVANLVHRVTLANGKTILHMGDADPNDRHFEPFAEHWQERQSDAAFPPYWFFISGDGAAILSTRINAKSFTGVHVPLKLPPALIQSGADFFSKPGERRALQSD